MLWLLVSVGNPIACGSDTNIVYKLRVTSTLTLIRSDDDDDDDDDDDADRDHESVS